MFTEVKVMQNKYLALALVSALAFSTNARAEGKNGVAAVVNGEEISVAEIKNQNSSPKRKSRPVIFWSAPNLRQTTLLPS